MKGRSCLIVCTLYQKQPLALTAAAALSSAEVYLGKWHGCDAAIKCLNLGLFSGGGDLGNHAAVADLVKEADILGRYMRFDVETVLLHC